MHLICTCNATYTVKEAVSTLYSHVYTVHAHYMYAVNTCIAQLKTYSEIHTVFARLPLAQADNNP